MSAPAVNSDANPTKFRPLRRKLKLALDILADEGATQKEAAARAGLTPNGLGLALKKPNVRAYLDGVMRARLDVETARSWQTVLALRDGAASEDVKLKAARTHLDAMGELSSDSRERDKAPTQLVQIVLQTPAGAGAYELHPGVITAPPAYTAGRSREDVR